MGEFKALIQAVFMNLKMMESLRVRISKRPNFSYKEAFDYCDSNADLYLDSLDIKEMLSRHCFYATDREVSSILNRFDRDCDGRINFHEFVDEISPKLQN